MKKIYIIDYKEELQIFCEDSGITYEEIENGAKLKITCDYIDALMLGIA